MSPKKTVGEETIGERIRKLRLELDLTQADLAREAGLTPSAIWQYEQGERHPTSEALVSLAKALNVSSDYLLGVGSYEWDDLVKDAKVRTMFRGYEKLSPTDKEKLLDFYNMLRSRPRRMKR